MKSISAPEFVDNGRIERMRSISAPEFEVNGRNERANEEHSIVRWRS
ncbi:hypothetical protein [Paenibacillus piscarius]|nr:hypothetical protein [Paenibacillus piscarius]